MNNSIPDLTHARKAFLCDRCGKQLRAKAKTGLCRTCLYADPAFKEALAEARRKAFAMFPEKKARQRAAVAESNRLSHRRARSGQIAREHQIWISAHAALTPEAFKKAGATRTANTLAEIPLAYQDDYRRLTRKVGAAEAKRMVLELAAANVRRAFA